MIFRLVTTPEDVQNRLDALVANHDGRITLARGNPPQIMVVPEGAESHVVAFNTDVPWLFSSASRCSSAPAPSSTRTARTRRSPNAICWTPSARMKRW